MHRNTSLFIIYSLIFEHRCIIFPFFMDGFEKCSPLFYCCIAVSNDSRSTFT